MYGDCKMEIFGSRFLFCEMDVDGWLGQIERGFGVEIAE